MSHVIDLPHTPEVRAQLDVAGVKAEAGRPPFDRGSS
jgi:hypothetical protein